MSAEDHSSQPGGAGGFTHVGGAGGFVGGFFATGPTFKASLIGSAALVAALSTSIEMSAALAPAADLQADLETSIPLSASLTGEADLSGDLHDEYGVADLLDWPDRNLIVIAEAEPSIVLTDWAETAGRTDVYEIAFPTHRERDFFPGGLYAPCVRVRQNDIDLDEEDNLDDVESNAGSWFWDAAAETLYVHSTTGSSPDEFTVYQAFVRVYLSTKPVALNHTAGDPDTGIYYHPWITEESTAALNSVGDGLFAVKTSPTATLVIANEFGSLWQRITASNSQWWWQQRRIRLYVGGSVRSTVIERANYDQFVSMLVADVAVTDSVCTLVLKTSGNRLDQVLPPTPIFESEYPDLDSSARGKKKPLLYGRCTMAPLLVDTTVDEGLWLVADAAFQELTAVHNVWAVAKTNGAMTLLTLTTDYIVDLVNCTVTVVNAAYPADDFSLIVDTTGVDMETAAEITEDLLRKHLGAGDDDIDMDSFSEAALQAPEPLSVALVSPRTLSSILMTSESAQPSLERSVLAVLREMPDGRWQFKVRSLLTTDPVASLGPRDLAKFDPEPSNETAFATTQVYYGQNSATGSWAISEFTDQRTKYLLAADSAATDEDAAQLYTFLRDAVDADALAARYQALAGGNRLRVVFAERSAKLYRALVGDRVTITFAPAPDASGALEDEVFEVTELKKIAAPTLVTSGIVRDTRGLIGGWPWAADTEPADWATATTEQRRRLGFWAGDDGRIDPLDPATADIRRWV